MPSHPPPPPPPPSDYTPYEPKTSEAAYQGWNSRKLVKSTQDTLYMLNALGREKGSSVDDTVTLISKLYLGQAYDSCRSAAEHLSSASRSAQVGDYDRAKEEIKAAKRYLPASSDSTESDVKDPEPQDFSTMYNAYSVSDVKNPSDVRTFYTNSCIPSVIHQGRPLYDDLILSPEVSYRVESYIGPAMLHTMSTNDGTNTMMRTDDDQFIRPICPTVVDSVKVVNGSNWGTNQWLSALLEGPPPNPPPPGADWRKYNSAPTNTSRKTNTMVRDTSVASSKPGIIKPQGSRPEYGTSTAASSQPGSMPIGPGKVRSTPGTSNSMAPNRGWHNVSKGSSMPPNVEFAPTRFAPNHISTQGGPPPGLGGTSMGSGKSVKYASQPSQPSLASGPSTYQASQTYSASRPPPPPPPPPASTAGFCSSLGNQSAHAYQSAQAPYPPREWIIQPTGSKYEDSPTLPPDGADKYQGTTMSSVPIHATYNPGHESRSAIKSGRMNMYTPETSLSSSPVDVGVLSRPSSAGCDHWHS